jgi:hypothetical protein
MRPARSPAESARRVGVAAARETEGVPAAAPLSHESQLAAARVSASVMRSRLAAGDGAG